MFRWLSVFLLVLLVSPVLAQSRRIDSLRAVLAEHPQADTFRVNRLNELARINNLENLPAIQRDSLATQALLLAKRLNYPYGQAEALRNLAHAKLLKESRLSRELFQQALPMAERSGSKPLLIDLLLDVAWSYAYDQNDPQRQGLRYIQRAIAVAQTTRQPGLLFKAFEGEAQYGSILSDYTLALQATSQSLAISRKAHLLKEEVSSLYYIGLNYIELADYEQALPYLQQAIQKVRTSDDNQRPVEYASFALLAVGDCYRLTGRYKQAIPAYQQALKGLKNPYMMVKAKSGIADVYEQQGSPQTLAYTQQTLREALYPIPMAFARPVYLTLGRYYLRTNQLDSALSCGQKVWQSARSFEREYSRDAAYILARAYAQKKEYNQAYQYLTRYLSLKDSLNNEEIIRKTTALRFTDQMAQQKGQITLLNKTKQIQDQAARRQKILILFLVGTLLMLLILAWSLLRNNRQKQRANALLQSQRDQTQQALTELKTTQTQLVQKEKMASLGELTAGIAHEIQNPLNFVNNFSEVSAEMVEELAQEQQSPQPNPALQTELLTDLKDNLHKILHHGQRASNIVKGMLEHSRTSTGQRQPTDLNALCDEYLRLSYHGLRAKDKNFNADLRTDFAHDLGKVEVVPQEIGQVLLNLFNNAFYAVQQRPQAGEADYRPTVTVSTHRQNGQVEIRVADNGTGISETVKAKIFQPFFTTKPTGQGTGLGLSLSYDIITKGHGGTLTVTSQEGEATTFVVSLPTPAGVDAHQWPAAPV